MTSVTLVRKIHARPAIVFEALTTPEGISSWWGPDAGPVLVAETDVREGGRFRVRFRQLSGEEHECFGEFLEIEPDRRIVISWNWLGGEEDPGESRVSFELRPIAGGVELTLTHARLAETSRESHEQGWNGSLDKLAARFAAHR
jgi:uncharacterized protein YndB with AHSA1/START domain